jgi:hypothetical protein
MELGFLSTTSGRPPFYAPPNIPIWSLYNKRLQIHISTSPRDQIPAFSQGIFISAYAWALWIVLSAASGDYTGQPLRQVPPPHPLLPHCYQEATRWVIAPLPNSSWILVSEQGLGESGNQGTDEWVSIPSPMESTMSPAPWEGVTWPHKSAFLHPEEDIHGLINLPWGW